MVIDVSKEQYANDVLINNFAYEYTYTLPSAETTLQNVYGRHIAAIQPAAITAAAPVSRGVFDVIAEVVGMNWPSASSDIERYKNVKYYHDLYFIEPTQFSTFERGRYYTQVSAYIVYRYAEYMDAVHSDVGGLASLSLEQLKEEITEVHRAFLLILRAGAWAHEAFWHAHRDYHIEEGLFPSLTQLVNKAYLHNRRRERIRYPNY